MIFTPYFKTESATRPILSNAAGLQILRDQFTIQTWLLFGAAIHSIVYLLPLRPAYKVAPVFLLLAITALDTLLVTLNLKKNSYLDGSIGTKFTALIPNQDGSYGSTTDSSSDVKNKDKVAILLLGFRSNHPLGPLAPGVKEIGTYFTKMEEDLKGNADKNGFLGMTTYLNISDSRSTKSEIMNTFYFRSLPDVHAFAHGPTHRNGWNWWAKTESQWRHMSISHEVYEAPKGAFEGIWVHSHPTGFAATTYPVEQKEGGLNWVSPIVEARKGPLTSSLGRCKAYAP